MVFGSNLSLANGTENSEYFGVVSANGAGGLKYSLAEGSTLPEGLTLSENGEITGTPTTAGIYRFTIVAEADGKLGDQIELTLFVANEQVPLTWWQKLLQILSQYIPFLKKDY